MNNQNKELEAWVDDRLEKINKKLKKAAVRTMGNLPYSSTDGKFDCRGKNDIAWWTNGLWGGLMWLNIR